MVENSINVVNNEAASDTDDRIDKNLRDTLAPFQFVYFITFNTRYHIKENRIRTKDIMSIFLTILATTILICEKGYELYLVSYQNQVCWYKTFGNFVMYFDILFYPIAYVFNAATIIRLREKNASFILKLNKIYKALRVKKKFKFKMYIGMAFYLLFYFFGQNRTNHYDAKYFVTGSEVFLSYFSMYVMTTFDLNIIFAICIMQLLRVIMDTWTGKMKTCEQVAADEVYEQYVSVMDAYRTYNDLVQNLILFHNLDLVIHLLLHMGIFVELFGHNIMPVELFAFFLVTLIFFKLISSCVIETTLVYECERFYAAHDNAMKECQILLKQTNSDHVKKICKNVRRIAINEFKKISIWKLYEMDVGFLQSVFVLITNYLLVIMQFENMKFASWAQFNETINSPNFTGIDTENS